MAMNRKAVVITSAEREPMAGGSAISAWCDA